MRVRNPHKGAARQRRCDNLLATLLVSNPDLPGGRPPPHPAKLAGSCLTSTSFSTAHQSKAQDAGQQLTLRSQCLWQSSHAYCHLTIIGGQRRSGVGLKKVRSGYLVGQLAVVVQAPGIKLAVRAPQECRVRPAAYVRHLAPATTLHHRDLRGSELQGQRGPPALPHLFEQSGAQPTQLACHPGPPGIHRVPLC
eukprot:scaffold441770_cov46-Prasinocladus_malaysianus.AAC.4